MKAIPKGVDTLARPPIVTDLAEGEQTQKLALLTQVPRPTCIPNPFVRVRLIYWRYHSTP